MCEYIYVQLDKLLRNTRSLMGRSNQPVGSPGQQSHERAAGWSSRASTAISRFRWPHILTTYNCFFMSIFFSIMTIISLVSWILRETSRHPVQRLRQIPQGSITSVNISCATGISRTCNCWRAAPTTSLDPQACWCARSCTPVQGKLPGSWQAQNPPWCVTNASFWGRSGRFFQVVKSYNCTHTIALFSRLAVSYEVRQTATFYSDVDNKTWLTFSK